MESFSNKQVTIEALPQVQSLVFQPLELRYRKVRLIMRTILILIILAIVGALIAGTYYDPLDPWVNTLMRVGLPILWLLLSVFIYVSVYKGFANKSYALRERDIVYKSGWLWKQMTTAPFNRVQHVSIDQGPIERHYNLAKLKIFTAGGAASDLTIPGLDPTTANDLKEFIVKKTEEGDAGANGYDEEE